jgi:acyl-CoA synthetase (AMP-forming)/AMP-acid ligase II
MSSTIQARVSRTAEKRPERPCIIHGERVYSYGETNERVNSLANALLDMGIGKGDKVAAGLYNCPEIMETWLAAFKIGAVGVNLNTHLTPEEIVHVLKDSETRVLVLDEDLVERVQEAWPNLRWLDHCVVVGRKAPEPMLEYETVLRRYDRTEPRFDWEVDAGDLAQLFYTGGTTGTPKGVMHTHESTLLTTDAIAVEGIFMGVFRAISTGEGYKQVIDTWLNTLAGLGPHIPEFAINALGRVAKLELSRWILNRELVQNVIRKSIYFAWTRPPLVSNLMPLTFLVASPITHATAWWGGALQALANGFTLVLTPSKRLVPTEVLDLVECCKVNIIILVGDKISKMILSVPAIESYDCSSLAIIGSSGAHWTPEVKAELHRHFPNTVLMDHLGSTESPIVSTGVYFKGDEYRKLGPGDAEVRIVNEEGREVGAGEEGSILVRTDASGLGYYRDFEGSRDTWIEDGWVFTGDSGTRDENGNIIVFGRGSDVINSGGVKIWAPEVEEVICQHALVKEVAVFGVPDPEWGESVMAAVVLRDGETCSESEISEFAKERLAGFKKPRYVCFVDELPVLPSGKIRRGEVKKMFKDYLVESGSRNRFGE